MDKNKNTIFKSPYGNYSSAGVSHTNINMQRNTL